MINLLHSLFHRPERGWDPVPSEHAESYATAEWEHLNHELVDELERAVGGFQGKRVLDLGGGPGQYAVAFAKRGARVTWHDISRTYMGIVGRLASREGVEVELSLGYLEDASRLAAQPFDFVFNRICWCYCMNDRRFAQLVYSLVKPGGACYINSMTPIDAELQGNRRICYSVNKYLGLKIGHPNPPHGRIARLLHQYPMQQMTIDYATGTNDKIFFVRCTERHDGG